MDEWMRGPLVTVNRFLLALTKLNRVMNLRRSKIYLLRITWIIKRRERRGYCGILEDVTPYSLEETPRLRTDRQNEENGQNMPQLIERMPQAKYFVGRLIILGKYRTPSTGKSFYPVSELQLSWCFIVQESPIHREFGVHFCPSPQLTLFHVRTSRCS
jgi:hypothetical protein